MNLELTLRDLQCIINMMHLQRECLDDLFENDDEIALVKLEAMYFALKEEQHDPRPFSAAFRLDAEGGR